MQFSKNLLYIKMYESDDDKDKDDSSLYNKAHMATS